MVYLMRAHQHTESVKHAKKSYQRFRESAERPTTESGAQVGADVEQDGEEEEAGGAHD